MPQEATKFEELLLKQSQQMREDRLASLFPLAEAIDRQRLSPTAKLARFCSSILGSVGDTPENHEFRQAFVPIAGKLSMYDFQQWLTLSRWYWEGDRKCMDSDWFASMHPYQSRRF